MLSAQVIWQVLNLGWWGETTVSRTTLKMSSIHNVITNKEAIKTKGCSSIHQKMQKTVFKVTNYGEHAEKIRRLSKEGVNMVC